MSGYGGRMDSGVSAGRAGGGPGRTALVPGLPHLPPARRAPALEPRFAARLGRRRRLGRGRDDRGGPTRLPVLTPCPALRSGKGGLRAFPLSRRACPERSEGEGGPGGEDRNEVGG